MNHTPRVYTWASDLFAIKWLMNPTFRLLAVAGRWTQVNSNNLVKDTPQCVNNHFLCLWATGDKDILSAFLLLVDFMWVRDIKTLID